MSNLTAPNVDEVAFLATRQPMTKLELEPEIVKTGERPEVWTVEAIDEKRGDVFSASFFGPKARERAEEYAREKFAADSVTA
ncbi:MAG: hypothetical protein QM736_22235 [Vicinamibacterales bacterium]